MSDHNLAQLFGRNERLSILINYLLVSLMLALVSVTLVQLGEHILLDWQGDYLVGVAFFISLESLYAGRVLKTLDIFHREWWYYRLTEWVVLLVLLKLLTYAVFGFDRLWAEIPLWRENFLDNFFTGEYLVTLVFAYLFWLLAGLFGDELKKLEGDERLLRIERESGIGEEREAARRSLANLILLVGAAMIFLVAFMRLDWEALWGDRPPINIGVYNIIAYFVLALILLSLTQLSILRVRWSIERIPIPPDLARRWLVYSAIFLLALGGIALVLPTSYSLGLLDVLSYILSILIGLIGILIFVVSLPFILLLSLIGQLFGGRTDYQPPAIPPLDMPPPAAPDTPNSWLELLKSLLFWFVFIGVIGFSLVFYLKQNKALMDSLRRMPVLGGLINFFRRLLGWTRQVNSGLAAAIEERLRRLRARGARLAQEQPWRFTNPRRLSPRQQVLFFYLALVRRGEEQGLARKPNQTPYEYARSLSQRMPEVDQEVDALTENFMEARYSQHDISQQQAGLVQRSWQRIKRALRAALSGE